jgi:hypothetical protein
LETFSPVSSEDDCMIPEKTGYHFSYFLENLARISYVLVFVIIDEKKPQVLGIPKTCG